MKQSCEDVNNIMNNSLHLFHWKKKNVCAHMISTDGPKWTNILDFNHKTPWSISAVAEANTWSKWDRASFLFLLFLYAEQPNVLNGQRTFCLCLWSPVLCETGWSWRVEEKYFQIRCMFGKHFREQGSLWTQINQRSSAVHLECSFESECWQMLLAQFADKVTTLHFWQWTVRVKAIFTALPYGCDLLHVGYVSV